MLIVVQSSFGSLSVEVSDLEEVLLALGYCGE